MEFKPLFSGPIIIPFEFSKFRTQVGEPLIPILLSIEFVLTPFLEPTTPSSLTSNFGTRNKLIPFVPFGASVVLAKTK